ncbi:MAG: class I adenylate-forming enzyme family protein [Streptosporangiaceae bacterium]
MTVQPFDMSGITRDGAGVKHYDGLPDSLVAMLRASVSRDPGGEAVVELGGPRLTYRALWDRAARVAGGLRAGGVRPGDRVAVRLPNGVDWVLAFFGAQLAGAVAVPVNTRFTEEEARYVIDDSGASYVFAPGEALPDGEPYAADGQTRDDLAAIFYTSGTTGFPKGAMTSHENFLSNAETCVRCLDMDRGGGPELRTLISVPLFHVTGCNSQLLPLLQLGGASVVMPGFEVEAFLSAIPGERINVLTSVPAIYWLAMNQPAFAETDVSGVRWVAYGGAPIAPDLVTKIKARFPSSRVGNGFGLTETSSVATFLPHEYAVAHADSVGFAAPVVDVRLEEPDPRTGVGELLIRGANVVSGYWGKPEATADTFVDRWLRSGDLARIDEEGLTYVVDRAKDMINRGGENVYCVEVENVLAAVPGVFEVAVLGVSDEMMGEKVGAVLVPAPGVSFDAAAALSYARERLADFKLPEYLHVRGEALPRNPGGKVLKPLLRKETVWEPARR